jgi:hypothetical protein
VLARERVSHIAGEAIVERSEQEPLKRSGGGDASIEGIVERSEQEPLKRSGGGDASVEAIVERSEQEPLKRSGGGDASTRLHQDLGVGVGAGQIGERAGNAA